MSKEVHREDRYLVFKHVDVVNALSEQDQAALRKMEERIREYRHRTGMNSMRQYVVISDRFKEDVEAAWKIVEHRALKQKNAEALITLLNQWHPNLTIAEVMEKIQEAADGR
ncbi:MAG: hypothetical protein AB7F19_07640 [Candidatus Babeliales bacterium]